MLINKDLWLGRDLAFGRLAGSNITCGFETSLCGYQKRPLVEYVNYEMQQERLVRKHKSNGMF